MNVNRNTIYEILEPSKNKKQIKSTWYDTFMIIVIVLSLIPLTFKENTNALHFIDNACVAVFIIDYLARWLTADLKIKKGKLSFVLYPFTLLAIIDLICILPSFSLIAGGFRVLKVVRLFRALRVFRVAKALRYSKSLVIIIDVVKEQSEPLLAVLVLAIAYIIISALIVFNVEPDTFGNFFDALYWASVSLTTAGYGDIYPVSTAGRIVTMFSSFFGIAVVALPAGILTAGYMDKLNSKSNEEM